MNLNYQQQEAINYTDGHLLIVAGPGTGKTHTITQKIAALLQNQLAEPNQIVALTFTRKAGEQLTVRMQKILQSGVQPPQLQNPQPDFQTPQNQPSHFSQAFNQFQSPESASQFQISQNLPFAGTFHSFCLQILRSCQPNIRILSQKEQEDLLKSVNDDPQKYREQLTQMNVLDFDGILEKTCELLQTDQALLQKLHHQIRFVFVDEYQDVNETQYQLIRLLTGPNTKLCAIGDPDQAIYSFRGANIEHFLQFEKDFSGTKVLHLDTNYRSTPNIVDCANTLIANNQQRLHKNLKSQQNPGPKITFIPCKTPLAEAIYIAKTLTKLIGGTDMQDMDQKTGDEYEKHYHFTDIAIIYRTNHQGKLLESALKKESLPFQRFAATPWFNEEDMVKIVEQCALLLDVHNLPTAHAGFQSQYNEIAKNMETQTPLQILKNFIQTFGIKESWNDGTPKGEKRWQNLLRLLNFATQFDQHGTPTGQQHDPAASTEHPNGRKMFQTFLDEFKLLQEQDAYDPRHQAVTLMSIHAAKGLEFPVVFIAGVEEGTLPHVHKSSNSQDSSILQQAHLEEERRLMYVGVTRAKERLFLTYAKTKQEKPMKRSIFIEEMLPHLVETCPPQPSAKTIWKKKQLSMW